MQRWCHNLICPLQRHTGHKMAAPSWCGMTKALHIRSGYWCGNNGEENQSAFFGTNNEIHPFFKKKTWCSLNVKIARAFQMFVTCYSSSSEQLQRPQPAILIGHHLLGVGINGEVDGRKGDVTQEASFGSLKGKEIMNIYPNRSDKWTETVVEQVCLEGLSGRGADLFSLQGAWVLMVGLKSPRLRCSTGPQRHIHHPPTVTPCISVSASSTERKRKPAQNKIKKKDPHAVCH